MSVKLTTPASLPARCAPGRAEADMDGVLLRGRNGGFDCGREERWVGGWGTEGWEIWLGFGVAEVEGDGESVTHILIFISIRFGSGADRNGRLKLYLWALVATSLATVWASVEYGLTWNTGKESLPSFIPRVERMTEMKWMQVLSRNGAELDLVRSCGVSVFFSRHYG